MKDNFDLDVKKRLKNNSKNKKLRKISDNFLSQSILDKYSYNFKWLSRPIIQYPQDIVAIQELIWRINPDLIIETGVARGGSIFLSASILLLREVLENANKNKPFNINKSSKKVLAIDIDIRKNNKKKILENPLSKMIKLIEGSSIDINVFKDVKKYSSKFNNIMVFLDSNHTEEHVLKELELYSALVTKKNYIVVFDTAIEYLPKKSFPDREWGPGNNPKSALNKFLNKNKNFEVDYNFDNQLMITNCPGGFIKRKF